MPKKQTLTPAAAGIAPDCLLSPKAAGDFLGVATSTLARWRKQTPPPIPYTQPGPRTIRYRFSDLCAAQHATPA